VQPDDEICRQAMHSRSIFAIWETIFADKYPQATALPLRASSLQQPVILSTESMPSFSRQWCSCVPCASVFRLPRVPCQLWPFTLSSVIGAKTSFRASGLGRPYLFRVIAPRDVMDFMHSACVSSTYCCLITHLHCNTKDYDNPNRRSKY